MTGIAPEKLGLANKAGKVCVQCLKPYEITDGGTVIFEITTIEK